ncbi:MAG: hypothetical protein A2927_01925 [Candidatus Komeilibacteria bacterium RIFCSPLOWO2_01_FULL_45_10]|uniref:Methyltransferase type 11 domain-containing protein n=1 Tax=Candidatus Komeilibacteria bacterium RIFCSPLOWO2_01_FULL_45_10 TaxID=1798550 RepID=A0A1G2BJS0_9BACT|nr:MAG: hypothetical protein A2927_01925 [Candidatus Komeilibacteria bacterium RIFCSPLOWO2_01_FULL_45_10]
MTEQFIRAGEYVSKGDYHRVLCKNWPYLPVYLEKIRWVKKFLDSFPKDKKILDVGCGEGLLVQEYAERGYQISGLDLNYQNVWVRQGDLLNSRLLDESFDLILCLDVLEHLSFFEQEKAVKEISRLLKKGGQILFSLPNLAHFASRLSFLFLGRLIRTSQIERHPGDRPVAEYLKLLKNDFKIKKRKGLFPTYPLIAVFTSKFPGRVIWWHKIVNRLLAYPNWCFVNLILARKK